MELGLLELLKEGGVLVERDWGRAALAARELAKDADVPRAAEA